MLKHDPKRLVFIDESGFNLALSPLYARAPKGQRAYGQVPKNRGEDSRLSAALALDEGVSTAMTLEGAVDGGEARKVPPSPKVGDTSWALQSWGTGHMPFSPKRIAFKVYVREVLVPKLRPGQIVVLDNLQVPENQAVREAIEADRPGRCRSVQDSSGL